MSQLHPVMRNKKGFTLLEALIAIVILAVMMLGSLKALSGLYQFSTNNTLRDHAVRLADEILTDYRNIPYNNTLLDLGTKAQVNYQRQINNANVTFTTEVTVTQAVSTVAKSVGVQVTWSTKGKQYTNTTSTIVANK